MKVLFFTNEYPPHIYGGAGIHVDYLTRELSKHCRVDVRCFGHQKKSGKSLSATGYGLDQRPYTAPKSLRAVFGALQRCLD
ncbi:MAG: glycogen synthase, partial [Candidatus Aminicenantes bacterium]|nr:glycogen synthase [Candidatus Aminicenantes bacterium]